MKTVFSANQKATFLRILKTAALWLAKKRAFNHLFWKPKWNYQDEFYMTRHLHSVLAIVNSVFQYAFLCLNVCGGILRTPISKVL